MDAKTFFEEAHRLCDKQEGCEDCPIKSKDDACTLKGILIWVCTTKAVNETIDTVEQWAKEHPRKTRLADFLEKYPNAPMDEDGLPLLTPRRVGYCRVDDCRNCPHYEDWDIKDCGDAKVCWNTDYTAVRGFGREQRVTTFYRLKDGDIGVACGCFHGTIKQFRDKVSKTHGDSKYAREYLMIADLMELHFGEGTADAEKR